ncbi:MAG: hypothetical protein BWZ11_01854 [Bacteroidetes bacterium ADurb.BinA395]|nr:MAG: hypothetical protein BWZ11_01854 [Bacteroidetes bacterium ADurb.BinA395]
MKLFHYFSPQKPGCTHFGYFHKMIHPNSPEKRKTGSKSIDIESCIDTGTQIFQSIGKCVSQFQVSSSSGLLHVVTRNGNGIELGHVLRSIFKNIGNNSHGKLWWINISISHHKFLQNIVLYSSGKFFEFSPLFEPGHNIESKNRQNGTVHGHGNRHFVQWNSIKQNFHIFYRTNGHTGFSHITDNSFVVGIVTTMRRQIKCYGKPFLTCSQITTIKSIGLFSSGKSCILADSPRTRYIHAAVRSSQKWRNTGCIM